MGQLQPVAASQQPQHYRDAVDQVGDDVDEEETSAGVVEPVKEVLQQPVIEAQVEVQRERVTEALQQLVTEAQVEVQRERVTEALQQLVIEVLVEVREQSGHTAAEAIHSPQQCP